MKKTLSVILTLAMVISMFAALGLSTSAAAVDCATWADVVAAYTADATASVKLTGNVTCDTAIATMSGTFDGNGYTVTIASGAQMFAKVTGTATIKNFKTVADAANDKTPIIGTTNAYNEGTATIVIDNVINNVDVDATIQAAGIIGTVNGETTLTMTSVTNNGDVKSTNQCGGIIGNGENTLVIDFTDVINNGDITGTKNYAGGILNTNGKVSGTMTRVINNGAILAENDADASDVGGLIGTAKGKAVVTFTECINAGSVTLKSGKSGTHYGAAAFAIRTDSADSVFTLVNCINTGVITATENTTADVFVNPNKKGTATASGCSYTDGTTTLTEGVAQITTDDAKAAVAAIKAKMVPAGIGTTVTDLNGNTRFNVGTAAVVSGVNKNGDATSTSTHPLVNDGVREYIEESGGIKTYLNKNHGSGETFAVKTTAGDKNYYCLIVLAFNDYVSVDGFTVFAGGYKQHVLDNDVDILVSADGETWEVAWEGRDLVKDQKWIGCDYSKGDESGLTGNDITATINGEFAKKYDNMKYVAYATITPRTNLPKYFIRMTEFEVYGSIGEVAAPPAGGDTTNPDTGDNTIFVAIALVAVASVGTVVITRKREQN